MVITNVLLICLLLCIFIIERGRERDVNTMYNLYTFVRKVSKDSLAMTTSKMARLRIAWDDACSP